MPSNMTSQRDADCSLIDLSSHSLRNFNELQKMHSRMDESTASIQRDLENLDRVTEEGHKDFMAKYSSTKYEEGLKSRFAMKQKYDQSPIDNYLNQSISE